MDYTSALFGQNARHVPAWLYVQDQGPGGIAFVGASRPDQRNLHQPHPLRYGSDRPHQFILGEIVVRPHLVVATSAMVGHGLGTRYRVSGCESHAQ